MLLSIIVPFYNAEKHLERCLNSLINQQLNAVDYEIILINDGSTDDGKLIAEKFIKKHSNIVLYNQNNCGLGASRNRGIELAKGTYVYFIDSDDYLAHNTLHIILNYSIKYDLDLLGFSSIQTSRLDLNICKSNNEFLNIEVLKGVDFLVEHKHLDLGACWYIIKRDYLINSRYKFVEGKFFEDVVFTYNIFLHAERSLYLPIDAHRYVKVLESITNNVSQNHLNKVIQDYISLVYRMNNLITEIPIKVSEKHLEIVDNIKFKRSVIIYFMFYKMIRSNMPIKRIDTLLKGFEKIEAYPLSNFIGDQYYQKKFKISVYIFNNKYLFYLFLYPIRLLNRFSLIKLL